MQPLCLLTFLILVVTKKIVINVFDESVQGSSNSINKKNFTGSFIYEEPLVNCIPC